MNKLSLFSSAASTGFADSASDLAAAAAAAAALAAVFAGPEWNGEGWDTWSSGRTGALTCERASGRLIGLCGTGRDTGVGAAGLSIGLPVKGDIL